MDYEAFVQEQVKELREAVGEATAINALSGGVDSSVVTVLAHRALGDQLKTFFIDSALMREGEPERVVQAFADMGIPVEIIDARQDFLDALKDLTDPEQKRNAVTHTFYAKVFRQLVEETGAKFLLHGTILTDIEETSDTNPHSCPECGEAIVLNGQDELTDIPLYCPQCGSDDWIGPWDRVNGANEKCRDCGHPRRREA